MKSEEPLAQTPEYKILAQRYPHIAEFIRLEKEREKLVKALKTVKDKKEQFRIRREIIDIERRLKHEKFLGRRLGEEILKPKELGVKVKKRPSFRVPITRKISIIKSITVNLFSKLRFQIITSILRATSFISKLKVQVTNSILKLKARIIHAILKAKFQIIIAALAAATAAALSTIIALTLATTLSMALILAVFLSTILVVVLAVAMATALVLLINERQRLVNGIIKLSGICAFKTWMSIPSVSYRSKFRAFFWWSIFTEAPKDVRRLYIRNYRLKYGFLLKKQWIKILQKPRIFREFLVKQPVNIRLSVREHQLRSMFALKTRLRKILVNYNSFTKMLSNMRLRRRDGMFMSPFFHDTKTLDVSSRGSKIMRHIRLWFRIKRKRLLSS